QLDDFAQVAAGEVFAHPAVAVRARGEDLGLPDLASGRREPAVPNGGLTPTARQADGLDWPLRLGVVWQQLQAGPVRFTQANLLVKKDLSRLQADEVLAAPPGDLAVCLPDAGVLALLWGAATGLV